MKNANNEYYIKKALEIASQSEKDIPIGAIIVQNTTDAKEKEVIVARCLNQKEKQKNPIAHAEILAIELASQKLSRWNLFDCDIYTTLEPCPMCFGAIINSRIKNLYFGAYDKRFGAISQKMHTLINYNHKVNIYGGFLENQCKDLISSFFKKIRNSKKLL